MVGSDSVEPLRFFPSPGVGRDSVEPLRFFPSPGVGRDSVEPCEGSAREDTRPTRAGAVKMVGSDSVEPLRFFPYLLLLECSSKARCSAAVREAIPCFEIFSRIRSISSCFSRRARF